MNNEPIKTDIELIQAAAKNGFINLTAVIDSQNQRRLREEQEDV